MWEVEAISSNLNSVYTWEADVCYPLIHGSKKVATVFEEGRLKSLYSPQIFVSTALTLPHAFRRPLPAPNIRILAVNVFGQAGCGRVLP